MEQNLRDGQLGGGRPTAPPPPGYGPGNRITTGTRIYIDRGTNLTIRGSFKGRTVTYIEVPFACSTV